MRVDGRVLVWYICLCVCVSMLGEDLAILVVCVSVCMREMKMLKIAFGVSFVHHLVYIIHENTPHSELVM